MAYLLLIDDDSALLPAQMRQVFPAPDHRIEVAATGADGLARVRAVPPDVILLDLGLPDQSGLEVYQQVRRIDARIPVIFVTMAKGADAAIEAMKQGAYDYLFKPLDLKELRRVVREALDVTRRMREPAVVAETVADSDVDGAIVGACPAMREVYKGIGRVATQLVPVLITGESGTGKELVARAIYQHSRRAAAHRSWRLQLCRHPRELAGERAVRAREERRLSRGPTDAASRRVRAMQRWYHLPRRSRRDIAACGFRPRVMRLLQQQAFEPLGGNETLRTDVRLIAATNRDLKVWSADGKFRPDLYYRLQAFSPSTYLPCASGKTTCRCWCNTTCGSFSRDSRTRRSQRLPRRQLGAIAQLCSWPGNIRELQSVLKQALPAGERYSPGVGFPAGTYGRHARGFPPLDHRERGTTPAWRRLSFSGYDSTRRTCIAHGRSKELDRILLPRVMEHSLGSQTSGSTRARNSPENLAPETPRTGPQYPASCRCR